MPFVKGQSGNPAGRPVGSRNRFTREMDDALELKGLPLIEAIVAHAHAANPAAMRLCLDRLVPVGKNRAATIELPPVETPDYTGAALTEIHRALGASEISTDEATRLVGFVDRTTRVLAGKAAAEIDLADRLARCEEALMKCMVLLGMPVPADAASPAPEAADAPAGPAGANNNALTMDTTAAAGPPAVPAEPRPAAKNNETATAAPAVTGETLPGPSEPCPPRRNRGGAIGRLMESTSPLAHLSATSLGKTLPAMPPRVPLAGAA
jgi:Family of unknown function (DUF5681)